MIPLLAALLATSSLLFIVTPRMPLYQVTSLTISKLHFSFTKLTLSATILAGVQIENANFIGADIHATIVDIYYPDWNGDLYHVGVLKETNANYDNNVCIPKHHDDGVNYDTLNEIDNEEEEEENYDNKPNKNDNEEEEDDHGICLPGKNDDNNIQSSSLSSSQIPFFTIQPRGISISKSDAVTIIVNDVPPRIYINFIKDAIVSKGLMEIFVSGVAHVKSPLGIPISLGIMCDNAVNLLHIPIQVIGKNCVVKSVSTGWSGLKELATEVREKAMDVYAKRSTMVLYEQTVDVDVKEGEEKDKDDDKVEPFLLSSEVILDWHDF